MKNDPLFSIIIPTYNSANFLKRALDSVVIQQFKDFEVLVCDDGSTDDTEIIIKQYQSKLNIRYFCNEHWGGPAKPRNNGIKNSKGKFIAFLDSDDWWYKNKLKIVAKFINDYDILFHDLDLYTEKGKLFSKKMKGRHLSHPVFEDLLLNENALTTSAVVAKREILNLVNNFTEEPLFCVEDFDLWLKIAMVTEKFKYIPKSLGAYYLNGEKVSSPSNKIYNCLSFVYDKYLPLLDREKRRQSEATLNYLLGRTKQNLNEYRKALHHFYKCLNSNNYRFKLRSLIWIFFIKLNLFIKRGKSC